MYLNIFSQSSLIGNAVQKSQQTINTRFGELVAVNDKYSKYTSSFNGRVPTLVERVSLNDLFKDIDQDISELEFTEGAKFVDLTVKLGVDTVQTEGPFAESISSLSEGDELGKLFNTWISFVGLTSLRRQEVELSTVDGYLYIDARRSLLFKGDVRVKYKKDE